MGLLEKALNYQNEINRKGGATLIDRIPGPAATAFPRPAPETDEVIFLSNDELQELDADGEPAAQKSAPETTDETDKTTTRSSDGNRLNLAIDDEPVHNSADQIDAAEHNTVDQYADDESSGPIFSDYLVLYETGQEILNAKTMEELTDTILFLVMGQLGATSSSLLLPDADRSAAWIIKDSRGIKAVHRELAFDAKGGILGDLLKNRKIIDIDIYKKNREYSEDYIRLLSIDTKIIAPLISRSEITAILILGEKISGEEYTEEELDFLKAVGSASALALRNIMVSEWNFRDLCSLDEEVRINEMIRESLSVISVVDDHESIASLLSPVFKSAESSFAVYVRPEFTDGFVRTAADAEAAPERIDEGSPLAHKLINGAAFTIAESDPLFHMAADGSGTHHGSGVISVVPVRSAGRVAGALFIYGPEYDSRFGRFLSGVLNQLVLSCCEIYHRSSSSSMRGFDFITRSIQKELENCAALKIPLTLLMLSVKNYKRIFNRTGVEGITGLFNNIEKIISGRISDGDTFIRFDRSKILFILPGKDRKFAVPFANSLKNEVQTLRTDSETLPLVTFLSSQYPDDGESVLSLMEPLE